MRLKISRRKIRRLKFSRVKFFSFTLIELLIVIAIITILAGMLLPTLKSARERVKAIQCLNNLKQVGLSAQMYGNDCNGLIPYYRNDQVMIWSDYLLNNGYVTKWEILQCPAFKPLAAYDGGSKVYGMRHTATTSYYPETLIAQENGQNLYLMNTGKMKSPSVMFIFGDSYYTATNAQFYRIHHSETSGYGMHARHSGNVNLEFLDGHAASLKPEKMGAIWKMDRAASSSFGDLRIFLLNGDYKVFPWN